MAKEQFYVSDLNLTNVDRKRMLVGTRFTEDELNPHTFKQELERGTIRKAEDPKPKKTSKDGLKSWSAGPQPYDPTKPPIQKQGPQVEKPELEASGSLVTSDIGKTSAEEEADKAAREASAEAVTEKEQADAAQKLADSAQEEADNASDEDKGEETAEAKAAQEVADAEAEEAEKAQEDAEQAHSEAAELKQQPKCVWDADPAELRKFKATQLIGIYKNTCKEYGLPVEKITKKEELIKKMSSQRQVKTVE